MKTNNRILTAPTMKKIALISTLALSGAFITANAATVFLTNDNGNAAALDGANAGTTTALTLSAADGGGTINLSTIAAVDGSASSLGMTAASMGVTNEKWGGGQYWTFSFDQEISFDGFGGSGTGNATFGIRSSAWVGATVDDSAEDWSFISGTGEFRANVTQFQSFDFTSAGVANVAAGTSITIEHVGGSSGALMTDFTITPIPEPSAAILGGLGLLALLRRRR